MEKFKGWYKGAQVYLVPQGNDYLYKSATLTEVVNAVNKIINLLGANGFLLESDPDA